MSEELISPHWLDGVEAWEEALEYFKGNFPKALSTGWPAVDEFYTVAPGQVTLIGGVPNMGKSAFADALMVNLTADHGWRFVIYSPENYPHGVHAMHLIQRYVGKPFRSNIFDVVTESDMAKAGTWLQAHFRFLLPQPPSVDGVLASAALAYEKEKFEGLVIDPFNEIGDARTPGFSEHEWISISMTKFRKFAREHNVHIWIVVHPKKLERQKDGSYPVPSAWDLSGSGTWRAKADNIITYWRDMTLDTGEAELHIQKIRFAHVGRVPNEPVKLFYNRPTGTFSDAKQSQTGQYYVSPLQRKA